MIKITIVLAVCGMAYGGVASYGAPALAYAQPSYGYAAAPAVRAEAYDFHPKYDYGYSISDALTGDQHSAHESRDGDLVQGQYSLVEPDGALRTVTYTADGINGFNAVVERSAPTVAVKSVQPVVHAAPVLAHHGPVYAQRAYASPIAHAGYGQAYYH